MGFSDAIMVCLRKYFNFSGRASRPEYWWFMLFILLASTIAGLVDNLLFGGGSTVSAETNGTEVSLDLQSSGPIASIFSLAVLVPWLSAGWRRMHDTGRSGLFLVYPLIVMIGLTTFMGFVSGFDKVFSGDISGLIAGVSGIVMFVAAITLFISPLLVLWWLTRRSQPGPNQYGPNPHEVIQ